MGGFLTGLAGKAPDIAKKIKSKFMGGGGKGDASDSGSVSDDRGPTAYHKGGIVRKTGLARLQQGEMVLTKRQQRKLGVRKSALRKRGGGKGIF